MRLATADLEAMAIGMGLMAWSFGDVEDVRLALRRIQRHAIERGVQRVNLPWRYETLTPMARLALRLYATGLFPMVEAVHHTHPGLSERRGASVARQLLTKVQEHHPAAMRAMEEGYLSMRAPLDELADAKLKAAEESMQFLRECIKDETIPAADRIGIAKDFLDRLPETAKISKNETRTTHTMGVQLPAEMASKLAEATARATRYLTRTTEEIQEASRGTDLTRIPEAEASPAALLGAGDAAVSTAPVRVEDLVHPHDDRPEV